MKRLSREDAKELIHFVRRIVEKEMDAARYFGQDSSTLHMEFSEMNFQGVSNGFLSEMVYVLTGDEVEVMGNVEELLACPCCGLKTLTERYDRAEGTGYEICPYCKWQDDGTADIHSYRSINKGSIASYRNEIRMNANKYYTNKWLP